MAKPAKVPHTEIKLKLRVQASDLPRLKAMLKQLAQGQPAHTQKLLSIYFDTPQLHLLQADAALRLRRSGRRWLQTLKGGGMVQGGLHQRAETEWPVARPEPNLARLQKAPGDLPWQDLGPQLQSVFRTEFTRRLWLLDYQGSRIEVALDQGWVSAGPRTEAILELELELKSGTALALFDLALELAGQVVLMPDPVSKAERGYRLFQGAALQPSKANPPRVQSAHNVEQAFMASLWNCLDQLQRNQRGVLETEEAEFVHQMRVALRRLRAVLRLFAPYVPRSCWQPWLTPLREVAHVLGEARDWDVFALEILPAYAQGRRQSLQALPRIVRVRRRQARQEARNTVSAPAYGMLVLELMRWLQARAWRTAMTPKQTNKLDTPLLQLARRRLRRRHARLRQRGRHCARLQDAQLHRLRIVAKQQRYAVEFLQALYAMKSTARYHAALCNLQEVLGQRNDTLNAQRLLRGLCEQPRAVQCRNEVRRLQTWLVRRLVQQTAELSPSWKQMRRQSPFWR